MAGDLAPVAPLALGACASNASAGSTWANVSRATSSPKITPGSRCSIRARAAGVLGHHGGGVTSPAPRSSASARATTVRQLAHAGRGHPVDPRRAVGVALVERLVAQQRLGQRVELVALALEQVAHLVVGAPR